MIKKREERILVVDDDPDMVWVIQDFLNEEGFDVFTVNNGMDAIAKVKTENLDLVILDIAMPNMNGIDTLRVINNLKPELKVVMITAFRDEVMVQEAYKLGALNCIFKPFELKHFNKVIKNVLTK